MAHSGFDYLRIVAAMALAAAIMTPAASLAGTKCKSVAVTGAALSEDLAVTSWVKRVRSAYGSAWANFALARNKSYSQVALPPVPMNFVSAVPCRKT